MIIIKILRLIHGFSEGDLEDDDLDPGCLGADDVFVMLDGIWEIGGDVFPQREEGTTLASFVGRSGEELALPAMTMALFRGL